VSYSPDGTTLIAQIEDNSNLQEFSFSHRLFAWEVATKKEKLNVKLGEQTFTGGAMHANAATKVGSVLIAGKPSEELRLTDGARASSKELWGWSVGVWFNPDGSDSLWLSKQVEDYQLSYGKMPAFAPAGDKEPVRERWLKAKLPGNWSDGGIPVVTASADLARFVLTSRDSRKLTLYNIAVDDKLKLTEVAAVPTAHRGSISTVRFSPDGKTLATGSEDSSIALWDIEKAGKDWKPRAMTPAGGGTVSSLTFSPDGRTLVVTTWDKGPDNLYFLDVTAGKVVASYRIVGSLMSVAYSPDGKTLVTGDYAGRIKAWDAGALRNPD
jgi:WD40 repeat protein